MKRASITRRLTTAFALVMALVLLGGAIGIYVGERFSLDRNLRRELARQSDEIERLVAQPGSLDADALRDRRESYVQVLTPEGREVAASPPLRGHAFLDDDQLRDAAHGVHTFQRGSITNLNHHSFRIRTEATSDGSEPRTIVVATRRDARDEALRELVGQLAAFGLGALALTVVVGYYLTRAAIRPVEQLRRQAHDLHRGGQDATLDVPDTNDEIAALATTLNELLARVRETVERERAFAAAASHELRTPLTALQAELDLALRAPRSHEELLEAVREASDDTRRLIRLAEDLLLLRAPDAEPARSSVALGPLVEAVARRHAATASIEDASVLGSPALIERAIENLVENASRYGRGPIEIALGADADTARVSVRDHGDGFPDSFLPRAFDQFARAPGTSSGTGTGLGLPIVEAIAAASGGRAGVENASPGAVAWIEFPLER